MNAFTIKKTSLTFFVSAFFILNLADMNAGAQCIYFTKIVTGSTSKHCLGIRNDGALWAWGNNQFGQLGDGNIGTESAEPEQISTATNWKELATGNSHSLAITSDGKLWAWGDDGEGELGDGQPIGTPLSALTPKHITSPDSIWTVVAACAAHSAGITADGKLWVWGYGTFYDASGNPYNVPMQVGTDSDWVSVTTGQYHFIAIKKDSTLWAWGRNGEGEAGDSTTSNNDYLPAIEIDSSHSWMSVSAGYDHTLALKKDSSLWVWGQNNEGELGDGTVTSGTHGPKQTGTKKWVAIGAGYDHSLTIAPDGRRWAWGYDGIGQFGNDSDNSAHDQLTPALTDSSNNWAAVYGGFQFSLNIESDGSVWSSGDNSFEELGDGTNIRKYTLIKAGTPAVYPELATTGSTDTEYQRGFSYYATDCSNLITEVFKSGANPIRDTTTAKVWIDSTVKTDGMGKPYVQRHYEINPASHDTTATGTVTLYFTQAEFSGYNAYAQVIDGTYPMLPIDSNDGASYRNNLKITKINGLSSDNSGVLNTYAGSETLITPTNVLYMNGNWEVTFSTTGFGGFFATTGATLLPLSWLNVYAVLNRQNHVQINWKVQEQNVAGYTIEKSTDGRIFGSLTTTTSKGDGLNTYEFTDTQITIGTAFYRIKQTDKDGRFTYSVIMRLNTDASPTFSLFPNPGSNHIFIIGLQENKIYHTIITDMSGYIILTKDMSSNKNKIVMSSLAKGIYLVKIMTGENVTTLKWMKE